MIALWYVKRYVKQASMSTQKAGELRISDETNPTRQSFVTRKK